MFAAVVRHRCLMPDEACGWRSGRGPMNGTPNMRRYRLESSHVSHDMTNSSYFVTRRTDGHLPMFAIGSAPDPGPSSLGSRMQRATRNALRLRTRKRFALKSRGFDMPRTEENQWVIVHDSAATNTQEDSVVEILINTRRIFENLPNREFREVITECKEIAISLIQARIRELARWDSSERARAQKFLGRSDDDLHAYLQTGMRKLLSVMKELKPENIIRWDEQSQNHLSCSIVADSGNEEAAVCKPDSARRIIAVYSKFCSLPRANLWNSSQVLTLIHECTHFTDVFDSEDHIYSSTIGIVFWAKNNPHVAYRNADSLACYIASAL